MEFKYATKSEYKDLVIKDKWILKQFINICGSEYALLVRFKYE